MNIENIVLVEKMSKYEYDLHSLKLTPEELFARYRHEGIDIDRILSSHQRQKAALEHIRKFLKPGQVISRDELTKDIATRADAVVALGGDNHLLYVSHFIDDSLVIGVNSDSARSEGALTYFKPEDFGELITRLERGDYRVERWTRLDASLNGKPIARASSEYFLGEKERKFMSRYLLEFRGKIEEQKSSGLLVVSGAGSTGWYNAASRALHPDGASFGKEDRKFRFLATELFNGRLCGHKFIECDVEAGEQISITSLNDSEGIMSSDSLEEYAFARGSKAVIKAADKPLNVVRF